MAHAHAESQLDWQRQEQQLKAEVKRLLEIGTPKDVVLAQAFSNLARPFAEVELGPDESLCQEVTVLHQVMPDNFSTTYLMVTDKGLIWCVLPKFEEALSLSFADVVYVSAGSLESDDTAEIITDKGLTITYRPSDYPTELRRYIPTGELDATFIFADAPDTETARMSILARTNCLVPEDDEGSLRRLERFRAASADVTTWRSCPICCHDVDQPTRSVRDCLSRRHIFSAPDIEPVMDESDENYGEVIGEKPWIPILESELDLVGLPLVWLTWRDPDRPFGPPKILDYETIRAVWAKEAVRANEDPT
jgi:hypothetical protein